MRWRQVLVLYAVAAVLAAEYWFVERRVTRKPADGEQQLARARFLPAMVGPLRELRLRRAGRTIIARRVDESWAVVEPMGTRLPPDLIAAFADALAAAEEIETVSPAGEGATQFGFGAGASTVELVPETGEPLIVTLGSTNPPGTAVYARRGNGPRIVLIGRNVRYYEELIFEALGGASAPAADRGAPVGG